jgi:hypothetical protein
MTAEERTAELERVVMSILADTAAIGSHLLTCPAPFVGHCGDNNLTVLSRIRDMLIDSSLFKTMGGEE